ncbi:hypothetical protein LOY85_18935 [Brevibacillus brevis]|nr:hypothetical protein [Brevibacillus brevis]UIO40866.1 hypothetical protein LOY85_18935 [Brevibacillus brevis]
MVIWNEQSLQNIGVKVLPIKPDCFILLPLYYRRPVICPYTDFIFVE